MRNIKLVVQYDGTDYAGFQKQPHAVTVQGELEKALAGILGEGAKAIGASRTDAGVHALGQVVAVKTECSIPPRRLANALNNALPPAIRIAEASEAAPTFHPRHDATGKWYSYRIADRPQVSPFVARYAWHVASHLDTERMSRAAAHLVGRHDFSAFEVSGGSTHDKVRTLDRIECIRRDEGVEVRTHADGYLYMMVRSILGTLVEVGKGRLEPDALADILASRNRSAAGRTAPPQGLFLERVEY
jgi:tRNA pseudouridine38-40 synthase